MNFQQWSFFEWKILSFSAAESIKLRYEKNGQILDLDVFVEEKERKAESTGYRMD